MAENIVQQRLIPDRALSPGQTLPTFYPRTTLNGGFMCGYPIWNVLDRVSDNCVTSTSLVSQVARAQIAAIRMASDPEGRFIAKAQLIGNRYTRGFSSDRIRETF